MNIGNNSSFQDLRTMERHQNATQGDSQGVTPSFFSEGSEDFLSLLGKESNPTGFGLATNNQSATLLEQLDTLISGYDRAALEAVQAKEKEESDWDALLEAIDRHIELTTEGIEEEAQEKLEQRLEQEKFTRELLWGNGQNLC